MTVLGSGPGTALAGVTETAVGDFAFRGRFADGPAPTRRLAVWSAGVLRPYKDGSAKAGGPVLVEADVIGRKVGEDGAAEFEDVEGAELFVEDFAAGS